MRERKENGGRERRQTVRQTDRQTDRQTHTDTDPHILVSEEDLVFLSK